MTASRTAAAEFSALDLRCHSLLADVRLHDVWRIPLDGGGAGRTMRDVLAAAPFAVLARSNIIVRALFALRFGLGRILRWDEPRHDPLAESYLRRLTDDDRARSLGAPGAPAGPFRMLYVFPDEAVAEVRNATAHAFVAMALRARRGGYVLYWAIYVKPVGAFTRLYMALVDPFRRLVVYPALIRATQAAWSRAYA
jgi:hypothetical protein